MLTTRILGMFPLSGNSGNWLLNSRFGAAEYRLMLLRRRHRAKPPAKNGNNGLWTLWFGDFLFVLLEKSSLPESHG